MTKKPKKSKLSDELYSELTLLECGFITIYPLSDGDTTRWKCLIKCDEGWFDSEESTIEESLSVLSKELNDYISKE